MEIFGIVYLFIVLIFTIVGWLTAGELGGFRHGLAAPFLLTGLVFHLLTVVVTYITGGLFILHNLVSGEA